MGLLSFEHLGPTLGFLQDDDQSVLTGIRMCPCARVQPQYHKHGGAGGVHKESKCPLSVGVRAGEERTTPLIASDFKTRLAEQVVRHQSYREE